MRYEWDNKKNQKNFEKHGVYFEEAQTVWLDPHAREFLMMTIVIAKIGL